MSPLYVLSAPAVDAYALTPGRLVGTVAALVAVAGVALGALALARGGKTKTIAALTTGPAGMLIGGAVLAAAKGGPGTGYGVVGGFAALVFGLIATALGALALARRRVRVRSHS